MNCLSEDLSTHEIYSCLLIGLRTSKAKDEQMAMGVCAGKTLTVRGEFTIKNGSMTLTLNLKEKHRTVPR